MPRMSRRLARRAGALATAGVALLLAAGAAAAAPRSGPPAEAAGLPELPRPRALDPSLPIQEMFRDWPPEGLLERAYWMPWSPAAFVRASLFGRPVLFVMPPRWSRLSQRMMEETLSDPRVLRQVNESYVAVQVNPDRRPDLRERYQTGTWPVVALLMPSGNPMLSQANDMGVARPITTGQVGVDPMLFILREGDIYFRKWAGLLADMGRAWVEREEFAPPAGGEVNDGASDAAARWLLGNADRQGGGFGLAPKFLLPGLYEYALTREARLLPALETHARFTLERLVSGPLYDGKHGGIHRMALAPAWGEIQYEKMLDVNTALLRELVFAARRGPGAELREAMEQTAGFVVDVLQRPGGGFYLGQCADPTSADGGGYWVRGSGEPPPVDTLVLAGPTALAGSTLLRVAGQTGDPRLGRAGREAMELVLERAYRVGRGVQHVIEPVPEDHRFLVSQADAAFGLFDAYESTGEGRWRDAARDIADFALQNLLLSDASLMVDHLPGTRPIGLLANPRYPMRPNVRLARVMLRLHHAGLGGERYLDAALGILGRFAGDLADYRVHAIDIALGVEEALRPPLRITIAGDPADEAARALRRAANATPWAWTLVLSGAREGRPGAVVEWQGRQESVTDPQQLAAAVQRLTGGLPGSEE